MITMPVQQRQGDRPVDLPLRTGHGRGAHAVAALVVALVSAATILLRRRVPSPYNLSGYDGLLYVRQANSLGDHDWLGAYGQVTLAKVPGYPLFMAATQRLGISVKDGEQLIALTAALMIAACVLVVTRKLWYALAAFLVGAFNPVMLSAGGADYLRDSFFASIAVLLVASLFLTSYLLVFRGAQAWSLVAAGVAGASLAAYLLTREEGVTVLPTALVALLAAPAARLLRSGGWRKGAFARRLRRASVRGIPVAAVLCLAAAVPLAVVVQKNETEYGVALISDWANGSFLDAYAQWQRVDAGPMPYRVPISEAQREAVYAVSPAARQLAPALEDPANPWRGYACTTPPDCDYAGGWIPWALRDAAEAAGHFASAPRAQAFFAELAADIQGACDSGELVCRAKLPSSLQSLQRLTPGAFADAVGTLAVSLLTSRDMYRQVTSPVQLPDDVRSEFLDADQAVPASDAAAVAQQAAFDESAWLYGAAGAAYALFLPIAAGLGMVVLAGAVLTRQGRRHAGPLCILAVALLFALASRIAVIAVVHASDYDADQPRYLYPAHALMLAFCVVVLVEGARMLVDARAGARPSPQGRRRTRGAVLPSVPTGGLEAGRDAGTRRAQSAMKATSRASTG